MIANLVEAIAYIAMAMAVSDLYTATEDSVLGRRGGFILFVTLSGAVVQMLIGSSAALGLSAALPVLNIGASILLLALPLGFWPAVSRLKHGHMNVWNRRLTQRAIRAEAAAAAAKKWLELAEQSGHVGHWQLSIPDRRLEWSDEIFRIHGLWREHYTPRIESALAAFHPMDGKRIAQLIDDAVAELGQFEVAARLRRPDGEIRHVVLRGEAQIDSAGILESLAGIIVDVTEPKRAEARLPTHVAGGEVLLEDAVTGLADRRQFDLSLGYEFKRAVRSRKPLGLVLLEIDNFMAFRRLHGASRGDESLRSVAQAVQAVPRRTGDVIARYDDFRIAVLLPLADAAGAFKVGTAIMEAVRAVGLTSAGQDRDILTVSCGAAAFSGMDDLYNPLELTRRATNALGNAQESGGNNVRMFMPPRPREAIAAREWQ